MKPRRKNRQRPVRAQRRITGLPERLRLAIASYGTVSGAATAIERSEGALRKWIRGTSEPNASDLRALCDLTGTSIHLLIYGEEEPAGEAVGRKA
jgi:hypothetical protein